MGSHPKFKGVIFNSGSTLSALKILKKYFIFEVQVFFPCWNLCKVKTCLCMQNDVQMSVCSYCVMQSGEMVIDGQKTPVCLIKLKEQKKEGGKWDDSTGHIQKASFACE